VPAPFFGSGPVAAGCHEAARKCRKRAGAKKIFAAIMAVIRYDTCCFVPIEILIERRKDLQMTESKCSNCGERCFGELTQPEDSAIVPIHYFIEKKPVCGECYQILRELEQLS